MTMLDDDDALPEQPPGRLPSGRETQQRLADLFLHNLFTDWRKHGAATVRKVREEKPDQYVRVYVAVLPREFDVRESLFEDVTNDQLAATHAYVQDVLGIRASREDGKAPSDD